MSRASAHRRAEPGSRHDGGPDGPDGARGLDRVAGLVTPARLATGWYVAVAAAFALLVAAMLGVGPAWFAGVGSVVVAAAYSWALAARTGGRPAIFGTLAAVLGVVVLLLDEDPLRTGAAVMTCVVASVLAVMATVPAVRFLQAARECLVAVAVAGVGALATVGFEPAITVERFQYATSGLALAATFAVVYRLGAGLHGLGRRGVVIVVVGGVALAVFVLYAELLRRYGAEGTVDSLLDAVEWSRDTFGASPRPIMAVLGIPALVYGCHMRARRRQGWWVCAFGAAGTSAVANSLASEVALREVWLSDLYGLLVGLVIGFVLIRVDLLVTGGGPSVSSRTVGRRSRRAEEATAVRPEPGRTHALL